MILTIFDTCKNSLLIYIVKYKNLLARGSHENRILLPLLTLSVEVLQLLYLLAVFKLKQRNYSISYLM